MRSFFYSFLSLLLLGLFSCDEDTMFLNCEGQAIVSDEDFALAARDELVINRLAIHDDCLTVSISASGCDGESWEVRLIGSEAVLLSLPPQRPMLLSLNNMEECEAFITRKYSFDLTPTQAGGSAVWLNFVGTDQTILYEHD